MHRGGDKLTKRVLFGTMAFNTKNILAYKGETVSKFSKTIVYHCPLASLANGRVWLSSQERHCLSYFVRPPAPSGPEAHEVSESWGVGGIWSLLFSGGGSPYTFSFITSLAMKSVDSIKLKLKAKEFVGVV